MLRRHKRKRAPAAAAGTEEEDEEWDGAADLIDDTMSSIQLLLNRNTDGFAAIGLPPLVVWHQLYTILPNRTFVDQNVHRLRSKGKLMTFKIPSGPNDTAILRTEDYIAKVERCQSSFRAQLLHFSGDKTISSKLDALTVFGRVLPQLSSLSTVPLHMLLSKITSESSYDEQHTRETVLNIQQLGFLLPTTRLDDETYSFSVPGVGKLVSAIKKTRTQILSTLKRTKYKELHEQRLEKAKLKNSVFQLEFHLADMEGCSLIRRTKVTSGVLVALVDK